MKKTKNLFVIFIFMVCIVLSMSGCNSKYAFLSGVWRHTDWVSYTDVCIDNNQKNFKYTFQNKYSGLTQQCEGAIEIYQNTETNQISLKLVINETSDLSFVVKSDSNGKTYLESGDGEKYYKVT